MDGHKEYLSDIIEGKKTRFVIPVYQRNYDWKPEQCGRLFDDLVEVSKTGREEHFFGSIVSQTPRGERVVIDGQQRITTVFLLFAAIRTQVENCLLYTSFFSNTWAIESARYLFSPRFGRSEQAA